MISQTAISSYKLARRIAVAIVGSTVLIIGIVMVITPGPAIVLIPVGLGILSIEFAWARYWLKRVRERISRRNAASRGERAEQHRGQAHRPCQTPHGCHQSSIRGSTHRYSTSTIRLNKISMVE